MDDEKPRCASKSKQTGKRCKRAPAIGLDKCAIHCGLSKAERDRIAGWLEGMGERAREAAEGYPSGSPERAELQARAGAYEKAASIARSGEAPQGEGGEP